jgi:hypothetical protein
MTVFIPLLVVAAFVIGVVAAFRRTVLRQARRAGYASAGDYLRAVPRSDEERRSAVDLALWGAVLCLLGILAPPLLLFGVFPLFYGVRKLAYASMGLGLVDDADQPGA